MTTYYKFLTVDGRGPYSNVRWHLPNEDAPGEWMPSIRGNLNFCERGYHGCREQDLLYWLNATLYELEYVGTVAEGDDKVVGHKARLLRRVDTWNERTAWLFAADCAEHVLPLFERRYPDDPRPRQAIAVTRAFARREATREELAAARAAARAAAWDAAWAAARAAARAAAWDAAWATAWATAGDAAWDAAGDAAGAAAGAAAWDAERAWQTERLMAYLRGEVQP